MVLQHLSKIPQQVQDALNFDNNTVDEAEAEERAGLTGAQFKQLVRTANSGASNALSEHKLEEKRNRDSGK